MNFLNSAFLAGLAAALVPLLIHLLNRRKVKTVQFSSVMFLRDLRRTRMRRLELRRWLLLAIRTLMIALAVLAFARPAIRSEGFAALGSRARTTAVVALDRSASMALETENGTAYERAQRRLGEIAAVCGEGDELMAIPFTDEATPSVEPATADVDGLVKRLTAIPVGHGGTDASAAVARSLKALATAKNLNREIYLLSDLRREGFTRSTLPPSTDLEGMRIYVVDVAEPGGFDLGIASVELANQLLEPGSPFAISTSVKNYTDRPVDRLLVSLFVDGRRVAQQEANLAPGGTADVAFSASVETAGLHSGFVEISADDNPLNNRRHFAIAIPEQIRVLVASDYPSGRTAVALAVAPPLQVTKRILVDETDTGDLVRRNLFDYDAVVISDWRVPDRAAVDQLLRFVRTGGGVFAVPAFDADTTAWNQLIAGPLFGLRLGPNPNLPSPERYFIWDRFDWNHPIWSVYRGVPVEKIPEVRWFSIFRTEGTHTGQSVVDFSGGRPSLSETRIESGKWLSLWSPLNAPYTDISYRSIFVPFVNRLVEYLAADLSERRGEFRIGERIVREPGRELPPDAVIELVRPDATPVRPEVEQAGTRLRIVYEDADLPGVYTVTAGGRPIDAFAVNVDPQEMEPDRISRDELARRWPGYALVFVEPDQALGTVVAQSRYGTEVRSAVLWAVAGLFFLEMFIARTRKRDMPEAQTVAGDQPAAVPLRSAH